MTDNTQQHLLITGAPRSGTTLLASMTGNHPDIAILIEDWRDAYKKIVSKRVTGNKLCVPNQIELKAPPSWKRFLRKAGLIKNLPGSVLGIEDYLADLHCKLIGIIRHGNHVTSSIRKRGKQPGEIAIQRWCRAMEVLQYLHNTYPDRVLIVSYELLLSHPEASMRMVCDYLDVIYQPAMLEGYKYNPIYPEKHSGIDLDKLNDPLEEPASWLSKHKQAMSQYEALYLQAEKYLAPYLD